MQREVVAAGGAPGISPPFLGHIPAFRRDTANKPKYMRSSVILRHDKKKPKPIHIDADVYKLEVQPGVECGGCFEP